jgi:hypothetical protein
MTAPREIVLSRGRVAFVDADDFDWLNQWKWTHCTKYAMRHPKRSEGGDTTKWVHMHREIVQPAEGLYVDHIDGNGLNNQRANLRSCTRAQNMWNTAALRPDKLKGAHPFRGRWQAFIQCNGARQYLGSFATEIDAALAYDAAAVRLHGAFARLNFPLRELVP